MGPLAEIRVTPCLLNDQIGNTNMTKGSCVEESPTLMLGRMRRVSAHLSPSRNALSAQNTKTQNAEVMSIERSSSHRATTFPLLMPAR